MDTLLNLQPLCGFVISGTVALVFLGASALGIGVSKALDEDTTVVNNTFNDESSQAYNGEPEAFDIMAQIKKYLPFAVIGGAFIYFFKSKGK